MTGTVLWSLLATNPDGGASVQLGYKTLDGQKIGYFYFPFAEGTQQNMDGFADTDTPRRDRHGATPPGRPRRPGPGVVVVGHGQRRRQGH